MMKLSTRSTYGMRALLELALTASRTPVSASVIAGRQSLSLAYLEQLLHRLKKRGLVSSVRGPKGGYVLARDPARITVGEVVGVLEDHGARQASGSGGRRPASARGAARAERIAQAVWRCVHERLIQSLDAVTLKDLCEEVGTQESDPLEHRYVFHI